MSVLTHEKKKARTAIRILLAVALVANALIRPVGEHHHMDED